jgi:hypothetical protein
MVKCRIAVLTIALSAFVTPAAFGQAAIQEPGMFEFYHPNEDVLNGGAPTPDAALASTTRNEMHTPRSTAATCVLISANRRLRAGLGDIPASGRRASGLLQPSPGSMQAPASPPAIIDPLAGRGGLKLRTSNVQSGLKPTPITRWHSRISSDLKWNGRSRRSSAHPDPLASRPHQESIAWTCAKCAAANANPGRPWFMLTAASKPRADTMA